MSIVREAQETYLEYAKQWFWAGTLNTDDLHRMPAPSLFTWINWSDYHQEEKKQSIKIKKFDVYNKKTAR